MQTLNITQTEENGLKVYNFTSRKLDYSVIDNGDSWQVWTTRGDRRIYGRNLTVYWTLADMAKRSKTFAQLVTLIEA